MIQIEELMIGNWVLDGGDNHQWTCYDYTLNPEFYHPIPLTTELLEKCGFELNSSTNNYFICFTREGDDKDGMTLLIGKQESFYWFGVQNKILDGCAIQSIYYLHQLQNIYHSLTNKQLIITL